MGGSRRRMVVSRLKSMRASKREIDAIPQSRSSEGADQRKERLSKGFKKRVEFRDKPVRGKSHRKPPMTPIKPVSILRNKHQRSPIKEHSHLYALSSTFDDFDTDSVNGMFYRAPLVTEKRLSLGKNPRVANIVEEPAYLSSPSSESLDEVETYSSLHQKQTSPVTVQEPPYLGNALQASELVKDSPLDLFSPSMSTVNEFHFDSLCGKRNHQVPEVAEVRLSLGTNPLVGNIIMEPAFLADSFDEGDNDNEENRLSLVDTLTSTYSEEEEGSKGLFDDYVSSDHSDEEDSTSFTFSDKKGSTESVFGAIASLEDSNDHRGRARHVRKPAGPDDDDDGSIEVSLNASASTNTDDALINKLVWMPSSEIDTKRPSTPTTVATTASYDGSGLMGEYEEEEIGVEYSLEELNDALAKMKEINAMERLREVMREHVLVELVEHVAEKRYQVMKKHLEDIKLQEEFDNWSLVSSFSGGDSINAQIAGDDDPGEDSVEEDINSIVEHSLTASLASFEHQLMASGASVFEQVLDSLQQADLEKDNDSFDSDDSESYYSYDDYSDADFSDNESVEDDFDQNVEGRQLQDTYGELEEAAKDCRFEDVHDEVEDCRFEDVHDEVDEIGHTGDALDEFDIANPAHDTDILKISERNVAELSHRSIHMAPKLPTKSEEIKSNEYVEESNQAHDTDIKMISERNVAELSHRSIQMVPKLRTKSEEIKSSEYVEESKQADDTDIMMISDRNVSELSHHSILMVPELLTKSEEISHAGDAFDEFDKANRAHDTYIMIISERNVAELSRRSIQMVPKLRIKSDEIKSNEYVEESKKQWETEKKNLCILTRDQRRVQFDPATPFRYEYAELKPGMRGYDPSQSLKRCSRRHRGRAHKISSSEGKDFMQNSSKSGENHFPDRKWCEDPWIEENAEVATTPSAMAIETGYSRNEPAEKAGKSAVDPSESLNCARMRPRITQTLNAEAPSNERGKRIEDTNVSTGQRQRATQREVEQGSSDVTIPRKAYGGRGRNPSKILVSEPVEPLVAASSKTRQLSPVTLPRKGYGRRDVVPAIAVDEPRVAADTSGPFESYLEPSPEWTDFGPSAFGKSPFGDFQAGPSGEWKEVETASVSAI